ncbi:hypothetical protein HED55_06310 [Ochrobactrum haematophilum]|uniref:Winged helix-turn helix domain-containing protein n=1 Tax=Brucella haematophila TaxID=419474 RepID=A0ABX1DJH5_9HYPH|nr:hypothetical protein [Brucella haematophila]
MTEKVAAKRPVSLMSVYILSGTGITFQRLRRRWLGQCKALGRKPLLNEEQHRALAVLIDSDPQFEVDGTGRWRLCDLMRWIAVDFGITASRQTVAREQFMMGYRKLSARPRHNTQDNEAIAVSKNDFLPHYRKFVRVRPEANRSNLVSGRSSRWTEDENDPAR